MALIFVGGSVSLSYAVGDDMTGLIFGDDSTGSPLKGVVVTEGRYYDVVITNGFLTDVKEVSRGYVLDVVGYTPNPDEDPCIKNPKLCENLCLLNPKICTPVEPDCIGWYCPGVNPCELGLSCPRGWTTEMQYMEILDGKLNAIGERVFEIDQRMKGAVITDGLTTDWAVAGLVGVAIAVGIANLARNRSTPKI